MAALLCRSLALKLLMVHHFPILAELPIQCYSERMHAGRKEKEREVGRHLLDPGEGGGSLIWKWHSDKVS